MSLPKSPTRAAVRDAATPCRRGAGHRRRRHPVPSRTVIREVLTRVDPDALDRALQRWNVLHAAADEGLAIDGKTRGNAIDALLTQRQHAALIDHNAHCDFIS